VTSAIDTGARAWAIAAAATERASTLLAGSPERLVGRWASLTKHTGSVMREPGERSLDAIDQTRQMLAVAKHGLDASDAIDHASSEWKMLARHHDDAQEALAKFESTLRTGMRGSVGVHAPEYQRQQALAGVALLETHVNRVSSSFTHEEIAAGAAPQLDRVFGQLEELSVSRRRASRDEVEGAVFESVHNQQGLE
jgi:hypothetical protein